MLRPSPKLLLAVSVLAGVTSCRKDPPDEHVYAGQATGTGSSSGSGGSGASGGSGGLPPFDAGGATGDFAGLGGSAPDVPFTKQNLLTQIADCALAHYRAFEDKAQELSDRAASGEPATDAQASWLETISLWQQAELFRFGPAAAATQPGGQDLRDHIYAWPLVSRCKIEEQLVAQTYAAPDFSNSLINGRTLWATEYLLFYGGDDNACSQFSPINAAGTWQGLGSQERAARKRAYAAAVAKDVHARSLALRDAWEPTAGNFRKELVEAGSASVYSSDQHALNAVSDALFYIDLEMKDDKLGRPAGVYDCFSASCPEAVESPFAGRSVAHMRNNLVGFRRLYGGCYADGSGLGFDDWLSAVGAGSLAEQMTNDLVAAEGALLSIPAPLEQAVVSDPATVLAAHAALKKVTDNLKSEFRTVLNLDLPMTVVGDND